MSKYPACILTSGPFGCPGRDFTKYCAEEAGASVGAARTPPIADNAIAPKRSDDAVKRILTDRLARCLDKG